MNNKHARIEYFAKSDIRPRRKLRKEGFGMQRKTKPAPARFYRHHITKSAIGFV
jgi:hypothetical protein